MPVVHVSRSQVRNFVRRALRRLPDEYIETVWGRTSSGEFQICAFQELEHTSTRKRIEHEDVKIGEVKGNLICLGTIHTHYLETGEDAAPSEADWQAYASAGEIISGICLIWKNKKGQVRSRVSFYFSQAYLHIKRGS